VNNAVRVPLLTGVLALATGAAPLGLWRNEMSVSLFKAVTAGDEVIVGLNTREIEALAAAEKPAAGVIAAALACK
jgi:hypothetical protein